MRSILQDGYIPLVRTLCSSTDGMDGALEHAAGLATLGLDVAREISGNGGIESSSSICKVANTVWYEICSIWGDMSTDVSELLEVKGGIGSAVETCHGLVTCMELCFERVQGGNIDEKYGSKVFKFLVSNFGKLTMCASPETAAITVTRLWDILLKRSAILEGRDEYNSIGLAYRAVAVCLNRMSMSENLANTFCKSLCISLGTAKDRYRVFTTVYNLWKASAKMNNDILKQMHIVLESMFKCMVHPKIQDSVCKDPGIISCLEDALVEYLSCHLQADLETGMQAIYCMIGFILYPHPLLEEVIARVSMRIMSCAGDGFQLTYITIVMDVLNEAVSLESADIFLSPSLEQCVAVASASLSCASQSTLEIFLLKAGNVPHVQDSVDVYCIARFALFLRVLHLSSSSQPNGMERSSGNHIETLALKAVKTVSLLAKAFRQPSSEDEMVLLLWVIECFRCICMLDYRPLGIQNGNIPLSKMLDGCYKDLFSIIQSLSGNAKSHQLLSAMVLLDNTAFQMAQKNHDKGKFNLAKKQNTCLLDRFDQSAGSAGWLLQIASRQQQRPLSAMKKLFRVALDDNASAPMYHLGMNAYIEYIHYASEDNITAVLPHGKVHPHTGSLTEEFKKEVESYVCVIKNLPSTQRACSEMQELQFSMLMGDIWESLSQQCHTLCIVGQKAPVASGKAVPHDANEAKIIDALQFAKKSLRDLVSIIGNSQNQEMPRTGMKRTLKDMQSDISWLQSQI